MEIRTFVDIIAWQKAHRFVPEIYKLTKKFPKEELFSLTSQPKRSSISIPANIAEGYKRRGNKDSRHFYNISEASLEESKYYLILAKDLKYINETEFKDVFEKANETGRILNGWKKSQK
ncbi:four helix bundle protein [Candidatus Peregrinibacteria bacterium]|nr:four helix bundle protein [Candidatus Peregrinibacteria bacterium]